MTETHARFSKLAVRDVTILVVGVVLWLGFADWSAGDTALADFSGLVVGGLVGIGGYLLHEWGHLLGALATRSHVEAPSRLTSGFLFSFDSKRNDLRQFLVMSFSGFAMTALVVWAFYAFLPDGLLATRVARGIALVGAFLTVFIELPLVGYALLGRGLPPVENGIHQGNASSQPL